MLKEHQAVFQLPLRAGGWAGTNAALCENKHFTHCVVCERLILLRVFSLNNFTSAQKKYARYCFLHAEQQEIFHFKLGLLSCQNIPPPAFICSEEGVRKKCNLVQSKPEIIYFLLEPLKTNLEPNNDPSSHRSIA